MLDPLMPVADHSGSCEEMIAFRQMPGHSRFAEAMLEPCDPATDAFGFTEQQVTAAFECSARHVEAA